MAVSEDIDLQDEVNQNLQAEAPLGEVLLAARIAKKLTQQDVSNSLRFSIKQIDALENNQFGVLPDAMITRGFIRNYARLLELDAEPLLASYRGRVPDKQHSNLSVQSSMRQVSLTKESLPWLKYILGSIVVLLFLLAWFFYMDHQSKTVDAPEEKASEITTEKLPAATVETPLPEIALPAAERQAGEGINSINGADLSAASPAAVTDTSTAASVASAPVQSLPSPAVPAPNSQVSDKTTQVNPVSNTQAVAAGNQVTTHASSDVAVDLAKKNVSLSVTEQTWVSVTDKAGKVVFEKMLSAGATEGFDAVPPLNVVIGNAKATKLTFAGQPVSFTTQTGSNVARIRLE